MRRSKRRRLAKNKRQIASLLVQQQQLIGALLRENERLCAIVNAVQASVMGADDGRAEEDTLPN